mmetsp:Transcript_88295/g.285815  ORF Transcript_88295/g.285815 Transcript_88295/m.285815 type:complete len:299 (+) Transcript_88295:473-1369(+)
MSQLMRLPCTCTVERYSPLPAPASPASSPSAPSGASSGSLAAAAGSPSASGPGCRPQARVGVGRAVVASAGAGASAGFGGSGRAGGSSGSSSSSGAGGSSTGFGASASAGFGASRGAAGSSGAARSAGAGAGAGSVGAPLSPAASAWLLGDFVAWPSWLHSAFLAALSNFWMLSSTDALWRSMAGCASAPPSPTGVVASCPQSAVIAVGLLSNVSPSPSTVARRRWIADRKSVVPDFEITGAAPFWTGAALLLLPPAGGGVVVESCFGAFSKWSPSSSTTARRLFSFARSSLISGAGL